MNEGNYCCDDMKCFAANKWGRDEDPFKNPDILIYYSSKFDEYGIIIHDGGASLIEIQYCPWCGRRFRESKRDEWFEELEKLGFGDFDEEEIPEEYRSDQWWRNKNLG